MNSKKAKALRRTVYGDQSFRLPPTYYTAGDGSTRLTADCAKGRYRLAKRAWARIEAKR